MRESINEAQDLRKDLERLRRDLQEKKDMNWQDRQKLENMLERQRELQQRIERTTQQFQENNQQQQSFREMDERLMEKQRQVQELFENVLSEEMKEIYRQVQELMEVWAEAELLGGVGEQALRLGLVVGGEAGAPLVRRMHARVGQDETEQQGSDGDAHGTRLHPTCVASAFGTSLPASSQNPNRSPRAFLAASGM